MATALQAAVPRPHSAGETILPCSGGRIVSWIIYCWLVWCERKTLLMAENLRSFTSKRTGCEQAAGCRVLTWTDGFYNGEVKTRKISNSVELTADQLVMQRSEQLRELYEALLSGECDRRAARPVGSLSPEDLGTPSGTT